jgi:general stress protein 26
MKTELQKSAELTTLCGLVADFDAALLTAVDGSGGFVGRPLAPLVMDRDGLLWFFTDRISGKSDQLRAVHLGFADPSRGAYVSLSGSGAIVVDRARNEKLWTPLAKAWFPDGPGSPNLAILKVVPAEASRWDAPSGKMIREFSLAATAA